MTAKFPTIELENTLQILCSPGKGHDKSSVFVRWDQENCMKLHPVLSKCIDVEWEKRLKSCSNLFNGSKFRLNGVEIKNLDIADTTVNFLVGMTSYKEFIGTNGSPYAEQFVKDGLLHFSNPQAYLSDPIGVGGLLVSKNDDLILIRRSNNCAEMQGMLDRPGGHPEPDEVSSIVDANSECVNPFAVRDEIFDSVLKEIRDEINVPLQYLEPPVLLGIGYNPKTWKRPSLEFYVSCSLNSEEIVNMYQKQTQAEADESTGLLTVSVKEILETDLQTLKFFEELTHAAQAALYFLKIFRSKG